MEDTVVDLEEEIDSKKLDPISKKIARSPWFVALFAKTLIPELKQVPVAKIVDSNLELDKDGTVKIHRPGVLIDEGAFKPTEKKVRINADGLKETVSNAVYPDVNIQEANTEHASVSDGVVRFDALYNVTVDEDGIKYVQKMILHIEFQASKLAQEDAVKRTIYYTSRLISMQKDVTFSGTSFRGIRPVYSAWVYFDFPFAEANSVGKIKLSYEDIIGHFDIPVKDLELMNIFLFRIDIYGKTAPLVNPEDSDFQKLLNSLDMAFNVEISKDIREDYIAQTYNLTTSRERKGVADMMGLTEAYSEAIAKPYEKTIKRQRDQINFLTEKYIFDMHEKNATDEEIAQNLSIPVEEIRDILSRKNEA